MPVVVANRIEEEQIEGKAGPDCLRAVYICGFLMQCEWVILYFFLFFFFLISLSPSFLSFSAHLPDHVSHCHASVQAAETAV